MCQHTCLCACKCAHACCVLLCCCLHQALERFIPDVRARTELCMVGTPLTHERFLRRHRGSYGEHAAAGKERLSALWRCAAPVCGL